MESEGVGLMLVDEYIFKEVPPAKNKHFYHYTGIDSFFAICENEKREIWATNAAYMNDSQELIYAQKLLGKVLASKAKGFNDAQKSFFEHLEKHLSESVEVASFIYVHSLSEDGNSLSQWRSYTPHGKGVCIEYDINSINGMVKPDDIYFVKCEYDETKQFQLLGEMIENLKDDFDGKVSGFRSVVPPGEIGSVALFSLDKVLKVLSIIKHPSFYSEKEWRVVVTFQAAKNLDENYRVGSSMLTPYVSVPMTEGSFIKSMKIGPTAHVNLSKAALSRYLGTKEFKPIKSYEDRIIVESSDIPYREW